MFNTGHHSQQQWNQFTHTKIIGNSNSPRDKGKVIGSITPISAKYPQGTGMPLSMGQTMTALRPSIFDNYNSGSHIDGPSFIQGADSQLTQMKSTNMESSKQRSVFDNPFTNKGKHYRNELIMTHL